MNYYPDEQDFKEAIGDAASQAEENLLCDWINSNRKIVKYLEKHFDKSDMELIKNTIKEYSPGL